MSWLQHALLDLGAPHARRIRPAPGRGAAARATRGRRWRPRTRRANEQFVDTWAPKVETVTHARHKGMLKVVLGEMLEHKRLFDQAAAGRNDLIGTSLAINERTGVVGRRAGPGNVTHASVAIALGTNLGDREAHLDVRRRPTGRPPRQPPSSPGSIPRPVGVGDQPRVPERRRGWRHQAARRGRCWTALLAIERSDGRERPVACARPDARPGLDSLWERSRWSEPGLEVPHPRFRERLFVLEPLAETGTGLGRPGERATAVSALLRGRTAPFLKIPRQPSSNSVYIAGTNTSVIIVEVIRPPITTRASGAWSSAPSPMPSAIGTRPSAVQIEVIRIGRRRCRPASSMAVAQRHLVALAQGVGVVHQQDGVADDDAGQHDHADVGLHAERRLGEQQHADHADGRQRDREDDDERVAQRSRTATPSRCRPARWPGSAPAAARGTTWPAPRPRCRSRPRSPWAR